MQLRSCQVRTGATPRRSVVVRKAFVATCSAKAPIKGNSASRRDVLLSSMVLSAAQAVLAVAPATATPLQDITRSFLRPDVDPKQAVIDMLDARSTLREIEVVAASPLDSQERFNARKLWPGFAKRLRAVAEAAPVVAGIISGGDKEATLSEMYGGKGGEGGLTDQIYMKLGYILTLSGRTIKLEAQQDPKYAREARDAFDEFLGKVPKDLLGAAQEARAARASKA